VVDIIRRDDSNERQMAEVLKAFGSDLVAAAKSTHDAEIVTDSRV